LPIILFTLSAFTFIPNTVQTPNVATGITIPRAAQREMLTHSATDGNCSDVVIPEGFSLSGIKIYFNVCALQHLTALVASFGAGGAFIALVCPECETLVALITALTAGATGGIDFLQYKAQGCGGVFLDISWSGGIKI